jgi:hypothetical protein
MSDREIHITSDGGVHQSQGTFGVVTSDKATPIIVNYGKLYSADLYKSSYRLEVYGGIQTLQNSLKAHNIILPKGKTILIFCDNKSLVKRINERCKTRITVNQHGYADIDLELQISHEIKNLARDNHIISITHVRSSKRKKVDVNVLPAEKQMNLLADQWCKHAQRCQDQIHYYKLPAREVIFVLNNQTINANIHKAMMKAYHGINLRMYLRDKYDWTKLQIDDIWWKA